MENTLQYDVIKLMESLKETHYNKFSKDILYLGPINYTENINEVSYKAQKDIFMLIEEKDGIKSYKFYDEKQQLLAVDLGNGQGIMATGNFFKNRELDFTKSILDDISSLDNHDSISLNKSEAQLKEYAKVLGVSPKQILSASSVDLEKKLELSKKDKDKIDLKNASKDEEQSKSENEAILNRISSKSEVDLDKKVTGRDTLGQILGISGGGKLIAVYSKNIANNTNTAEFSFIIQKSDGSLQPADMLEQVYGNHPDKDMVSVNRDGSEVKEQQVNSMFEITSTSNSNDTLSIKRGNHGILELSYGQMDATNHNQGMSIPLETDNIRPITSEVRNEMNDTKGKYNITDNLDEYNSHKDVGCDEVTLQEANGEKDGHEHISDNQFQIDFYVDKILENDTINLNYSKDEVEKQFIQIAEKHDDWSLEQVQKYVEADLELAAPINEHRR